LVALRRVAGLAEEADVATRRSVAWRLPAVAVAARTAVHRRVGGLQVREVDELRQPLLLEFDDDRARGLSHLAGRLQLHDARAAVVLHAHRIAELRGSVG